MNILLATHNISGNQFTHKAIPFAQITSAMGNFDIVFTVSTSPTQWYYMIKMNVMRFYGFIANVTNESISFKDTAKADFTDLSALFKCLASPILFSVHLLIFYIVGFVSLLIHLFVICIMNFASRPSGVFMSISIRLPDRFIAILAYVCPSISPRFICAKLLNRLFGITCSTHFSKKRHLNNSRWFASCLLSTCFADRAQLVPMMSMKVFGSGRKKLFACGALLLRGILGYSVAHGKVRSFSSRIGMLAHRRCKTLLSPQYTTNQPVEQLHEALDARSLESISVLGASPVPSMFSHRVEDFDDGEMYDMEVSDRW